MKMSSMKKASLQEKKFISKNEEASKNNKLKKPMAPTPKLRSFKVLDEDSHVAKYTAVSMALENLLEISVISTKNIRQKNAESWTTCIVAFKIPWGGRNHFCFPSLP